MIAYPEDGGDIRQGGGHNAPSPTDPARTRKERLIEHVSLARQMGLSLEDAVHGLEVSAATVQRWLDEEEVQP